ncbi:hypothetical protein BD309DRAFT_878546, partial [Dichomitus squalens]
DRAGVIVTKSIDYYENWRPLCEFFWRISQLPDDKLGFDPTAARLSESDPEWAKMNALAIPLESDANSQPRPLNDGELESESEEEPTYVFDYVRQIFARSLSDSQWPRYKLQMHCGGGVRDFLVGKPTFCANGAIGRGTRC